MEGEAKIIGQQGNLDKIPSVLLRASYSIRIMRLVLVMRGGSRAEPSLLSEIVTMRPMVVAWMALRCKSQAL